MAVDLTTGSYDKDGVFNKHNEDVKVSEKYDVDDIFCSLKNFRATRVIKECLHEKSIVVEGRFAGDEKPVIVVVEKMPFETKDINRLFTANCRLELKFRNNIYANYHVYPSTGFNGFDVKVIYPASEEDFMEFIDEPVRMVNESIELYNTAVSCHFTDLTRLSYEDGHPNATTIYDEEKPEVGFVLMESKPENCACTASKHVRAVCIVKQKDVLSLRDLTAESIPLLSHIKQKCLEELSNKYSLPDSKFLSYISYPPEHFPFHIIFETVEKDHPIPAEKAHHLDTVIFNLQLIPDYYKKVTLIYSLKEKDILLKKIHDVSNNEH